MFGTRRLAQPKRFEFKRRPETGRREIRFRRLRSIPIEGGRSALIRLLMLFGAVLLLIRWLSR